MKRFWKSDCYRFGDFYLNAYERTLSKQGSQIEVHSKTFDVLLLLVDRSGEMLSKHEILDIVWGDSFVEEGNLTVHVFKLRKLLGANPEDPYIKTLTGQGYQFVKHVEPVESDPSEDEGRKADDPQLDSIAVLPLRNENGDEEIDYLADGLTESLINSLSYMPDFRVIARDTVFRFKNKEVDPQEIGNALGVATILTGRLRVINDNLMIGVELIRVQDGTQIWGSQINEPLSDILEMQERLAVSIVREFRSHAVETVMKSIPRTTTVNSGSYRLYLKGRYFLENRSFEHLNRALKYFRESILFDPTNALAYVGQAECHLWFYLHDHKPYWEIASEVHKLAEQASRLNAALPELIILNATSSLDLDWDLSAATGFVEKSLSVNPNSIRAREMRAFISIISGNNSEALLEIKEIIALAPISALHSQIVGRFFYQMGDFVNAQSKLEEAIELDPANAIGYFMMGAILIERNRCEEAISALDTAFGIQPHPETLAMKGYAYARRGEYYKTRKILDRLKRGLESQTTLPSHIGFVQLALGNKVAAFECLEKAFVAHDAELITLNISHRWSPLRGEPRFRKILGKIGIPIL